jgi:ribose transport system ATP-binding protein
MRDVARTELGRIGFDNIDVTAPLGEYSLGIQQIVEVLRTVLSGARILVMDEPTSALSPAEIKRLLDLIQTFRAQKRSIIYISHFLDEVMQVADRITVLRNGQSVATLNRDETDINHLISLILGREINTQLPEAIITAHEHTLLDVDKLTSDVFKEISIQIHQGEIIGLYGPVGAGHFDVARALYGLYRVDSGTVRVEGKTLPSNYDAAFAIHNGFAYVTESRRKGLFMEDPIYMNVTLPHLTRLSAFAPQHAQEVSVTKQAITRVDVRPPDPLIKVGKLSGGNQQKVAIARWLIFPPKILIVSEPTRGMDVGAKNDVLSILRNLRNEGYGILVVSSEPETVLAVADRIITMSRGRVTGHLENHDVDKDVLMRLI